MGYLTVALGEQATNRPSYHVCAFTVRPGGGNLCILRKVEGRRRTLRDDLAANREQYDYPLELGPG